MKKIVAVIDKGVNYLFHLMAVARVGYDSDYSERHAHSVSEESRRILSCKRQHLSFANGGAGDLVFLMLFFPAYLDLDTSDRLQEYFELLIHGLKGKDCSHFYDRYVTAFSRQAKWTYSVGPEWILTKHAHLLPTIEKLASVYQANYASYESGVWTQESAAMQNRADQLNNYFSTTDLIGEWENLTGMEFELHPYEICLCSAIKNGPNSNSLGYDRNVFYHGTDYDRMLQAISHEIGTHILMPIRKRTLGQLDNAIGYKAYEGLARYYNSKIVGSKHVYLLSDYYDNDTFYAIYEEIYLGNRSLTPEAMLIKGEQTYTDQARRNNSKCHRPS